MEKARIRYTPGKLPKGYCLRIGVKGTMEFADSHARIVVNPIKYYQHRATWEQYCKQVKAKMQDNNHDHVVLSFENEFLSEDQKVQNTIRLIIEMFGIECYTKQCYHVLVHHLGPAKDFMVQSVHFALYITEARLMAMLPGNVATPEKVQILLRNLFKKVPNISWKVMHKKYLEKHGYNLLTSIGNSSKYPPCMAVVERKGTVHGKTICIVGKGITFDTGGITLKPAYNLQEMKYDKIGVIFAAYALYQLLMDPSLREHTLIGVFPLAENAISEMALRPGDVVTSYIGKTVEVINPDAEGRLILADAFGYLHAKKPDVLLDIATLTGHAEIIHCDHSGYFYATRKDWRNMIETGSYNLGERMIPMPVWEDDPSLLRSEVADLVNTPIGKGCPSQSYIATMFLKEFVPKGCDWLHIDLANAVKGNVPVGHGIATLIHAVRSWVPKNKK